MVGPTIASTNPSHKFVAVNDVWLRDISDFSTWIGLVVLGGGVGFVFTAWGRLVDGDDLGKPTGGRYVAHGPATLRSGRRIVGALGSG